MNRIISIALILLWTSFVVNLNAQECILYDDFQGNQLDSSWIHFQSQYYSDTIMNGKLIVTIDPGVCNNNCPWFNSQSAGFIYKNVGGNFDFVSRTESIISSGPNEGQDISNDTQLAGIMVREANSPPENYIFNVVGTRFDIPSIETKTTVNGSSSGGIQHFAIDSTRSDLRMVRQDSLFQLYSRNIGDSIWILRSSIIRLDFPDTLQLGLIAYAFQSYPMELTAKFDFVSVTKLILENKWLGGNGMWDDPNMWSLNKIPDASHNVVFDNAQQQIVTINQNQVFECNNVEILSDSTELKVEGILNINSKNGCN
jgi:hypothetical protein